MKFRFIRLLEYPFGKKKRKKIVKKNIKPQYKPKIKKDKLAVVDLIECERKKADKIPPFRIEGDQIIKNILGINFYFCEESYKKFVNEFASAGLDTEYDDYECYLIRRKGDYVESFHRWLMNNKLEEMAIERKCSTNDLEVHHKNGNHKDNRLCNLVVVSKVEHREHHKKEKAYRNRWKGTRRDFEDWWFRNHKEDRDPVVKRD
jgi:hypothetical protein